MHTGAISHVENSLRMAYSFSKNYDSSKPFWSLFEWECPGVLWAWVTVREMNIRRNKEIQVQLVSLCLPVFCFLGDKSCILEAPSFLYRILILAPYVECDSLKEQEHYYVFRLLVCVWSFLKEGRQMTSLNKSMWPYKLGLAPFSTDTLPRYLYFSCDSFISGSVTMVC